MGTKLCTVYITASNKDEAEKIAKKIVSSRLAACANIYEDVTSFYRWEGKIQKDREAVLILKTKESLLSKIKKEVKRLHSYSCPCFLAMPVIYADKEYARWIESQLVG